MSLERDIHAVLEKLSNNESDQLTVKDEWIEKAGEDFKEALRRQIGRQKSDFRLRASNIGRSLCQLQMGASGATEERKSYNFVMRMLHGDAVECIMDLVLKIAGANITGGKSKVEMKLKDAVIKGEDDVEIDNKVYDIKTCSPFAYQMKWKKGLDALKEQDDFGYIGQLVLYAEAQNMDTGGWIVVDKSSGEVLVLDAAFTDQEKQVVISDMNMKATAIAENWEFERCFEPVEDFFNRKYTNSKKLCMSCTFCDFKQACWPKAKLLPQPRSKAKEPKLNWYVQYEGEEF